MVELKLIMSLVFNQLGEILFSNGQKSGHLLFLPTAELMGTVQSGKHIPGFIAGWLERC